jgi:hypothetical protein
MISCQVVSLLSTKYDGAHNTTSKKHITKTTRVRRNTGLVAKRSKAESDPENVSGHHGTVRRALVVLLGLGMFTSVGMSSTGGYPKTTKPKHTPNF